MRIALVQQFPPVPAVPEGGLSLKAQLKERPCDGSVELTGRLYGASVLFRPRNFVHLHLHFFRDLDLSFLAHLMYLIRL